MKLIFHIGTEKTGTTTVQRWLTDNRETLLPHGVFHSRVLGEMNHQKIYLWALPEDVADAGFGHVGIHSLAARKAFRDALPGDLGAEIEAARAAGCHTFVISNEHCHSRLRSQEMVDALKALLAPQFDEIEILCSLRPQIDVAVSLASTASRVRRPVNRIYFRRASENNLYYNYDKLVERWEAAFGPGNVTLVPFRRTPDMVKYLSQRLALPEDADLVAPRRVNEALDVRTMALVEAVRPYQKEEGKFGIAPMRDMFLDLLPMEEGLRPGRDMAEEVQANCATSNAALAARRADITLEDLTPDWGRYDSPANLDLLEQPCAFGAQLDALIVQFNLQIAHQRTLRLLAEGELALANGKRVPARRKLVEARGLIAASAAAGGTDQGMIERRATALARKLKTLKNKA